VARVRVTRHEGPFVGAVRVLMTNPVGGVVRDMYRRGQNVRSAAMNYVGVDTGRLLTSLHVEQVRYGDAVGARVGSNVEHALVHHEGHGPLVPRRPGGVMVFRVRGGPLVFTKHVRAVEGTEYLRKGLEAARD
jgi:hypothetical protein